MNRFWSKVEKTDGCWIWTASKRPNGYGAFSYLGRGDVAHRVAWMLEHGDDSVPEGMYVCHSCDTPACVRIDHLFLGTPSDNVADMHQKGRGRKNYGPRPNFRGEKHPNSKLTDEQRRDLVEAYRAGGVTQAELARQYGLEQTGVSYIIRRAVV